MRWRAAHVRLRIHVNEAKAELTAMLGSKTASPLPSPILYTVKSQVELA